MPSLVSVTERQIFAALRSFLLDVVPAGTEVIRGQINRVPQPKGPNYLVMTPLSRDRLSTNRDVYEDCAYEGAIAGTVLTASKVLFGSLIVGAPVYGEGVVPGTSVTALATGAGGEGTYTVSPAQTIASRPLFSGVGHYHQPVQITVQLDIYGPESGDNAQRVTTLFRDEVGCRLLRETGADVQPLYTSEPRQMPFMNGEQQVESRETVDLVLQANPIVTLPQQFADALRVTLALTE